MLIRTTRVLLREFVQGFNFRWGIQTKEQLCQLIKKNQFFISISYQNYSLYWQKLSTILENKELQKLEQSRRWIVKIKHNFAEILDMQM